MKTKLEVKQRSSGIGWLNLASNYEDVSFHNLNSSHHHCHCFCWVAALTKTMRRRAEDRQPLNSNWTRENREGDFSNWNGFKSFAVCYPVKQFIRRGQIAIFSTPPSSKVNIIKMCKQNYGTKLPLLLLNNDNITDLVRVLLLLLREWASRSGA